MFRKHYYFYLIIFVFLFIKTDKSLFACTTGLTNKSNTCDNRSILWKNRDSSSDKNEITFFKYSNVRFIGLINADDTTQVWAGVNNFGFAIMNAESRDMICEIQENTQYDNEGVFMKEALIKCKTINDFETFLKETNKTTRKVTSNFGVIDASGCASFFETGNNEYFRFDASDTSSFPDGFIIRANFSEKGKGKKKYGYARYQKAHDIFTIHKKQNTLKYSSVIKDVIADIQIPDQEIVENIHYNVKNTINRYRTVSVAVFHGIKKNENPELTTFWCNLGEAAVSISIPLWVYSNNVPELLDSIGNSPLNEKFRHLKQIVYTKDKHLINTDILKTIRKKFDKVQHDIFKQTEKKLDKWRKGKVTQKEVELFQKKMTRKAYKAAQKMIKKL